MDHPISSLDVRPWRTATLVASAVATLELILLVVAGVALLGEPVAERVRAAAREEVLPPARPKPNPAAHVVLARPETSVVVLNGNGRAGAAAEAAARVHKLRYIVGAVGNAPRSDYTQSVVMYRPGRRAEAARLARDLGVPLVAPLDGLRVDELMGAHVAFVVGE